MQFGIKTHHSSKWRCTQDIACVLRCRLVHAPTLLQEQEGLDDEVADLQRSGREHELCGHSLTQLVIHMGLEEARDGLLEAVVLRE